MPTVAGRRPSTASGHRSSPPSSKILETTTLADLVQRSQAEYDIIYQI